MRIPNLSGKVCLVTGASRGIGRGIAQQLVNSGATVYITGRKLEDLKRCAEEMKQSAGVTSQDVFPLQVDHGREVEIEKLFQTIKSERSGQLDILVNNAYSAVNHIFENMGKPFWEADPAYSWDVVNNVGLRNHFICSTFAARMMTERKSGLIVNISSAGGLKYLFNVPYGVGKAALDRMTQDTAVELKKHNVAVIGLWPGPVKTEMMNENILDNAKAPKASKDMFGQGETPDFAGKALVHLANDSSQLMKRTGRTLFTIDLANEYKFTEDDGSLPVDFFSMKNALKQMRHPWLAALFPSSVKMPKTLVYLAGFKF